MSGSSDIAENGKKFLDELESEKSKIEYSWLSDQFLSVKYVDIFYW